MEKHILLLAFVLCLQHDLVFGIRKTHTALTRPLTLYQGQVANTYHELSIPKGPIAIYKFQAQVVEKDKNGNIVQVPTYDAYLHHHVVGSSFKSTESVADSPMKPKNISRAIGFGAGTECRGTPQEFYFPYAFITTKGEDSWIANVHIINTRKLPMKKTRHCLECPCTTENAKYSVVNTSFYHCNTDLINEENTACSSSTYIGGLRCCENNVYCINSNQRNTESVTSTYYLQYRIEYDIVVSENNPLYLASCCDATGNLTVAGNTEYDISVCNKTETPECIHKLTTYQYIGGSAYFPFAHGGPIKPKINREIELVYMVGHQHRGGIGISIYDDKSGKLICESIPTYGKSNMIGDENGYVVSMSTCTFKPPLKMFTYDILKIVASYNNTISHTGVMSLVYLAISDVGHYKNKQQLLVSDNEKSSFSFSVLLFFGIFIGMILIFGLKRSYAHHDEYTPLQQVG